MKFYKIRHNPTGLYYKPSTHGSKSNLSKLGKVYQRQPGCAFSHIMSSGYYHPDDVAEHSWNPPVRQAEVEEFEVVPYDVKE